MVLAVAGAINITATGGSGNYTFAWSNGASTEDLVGLSAGNYAVTVTDNADGCATTLNFTVENDATYLRIGSSIFGKRC